MNLSNVNGYKLTNGLDLIAKCEDETDKSLSLKDAFFLQTVQQQDGSINVEYTPLTILGKPSGKTHMGFDVELPRSSVLFQFELNPGIIDRYNTLISPIDLSFAPSVK